MPVDNQTHYSLLTHPNTPGPPPRSDGFYSAEDQADLDAVAKGVRLLMAAKVGDVRGEGLRRECAVRGCRQQDVGETAGPL